MVAPTAHFPYSPRAKRIKKNPHSFHGPSNSNGFDCSSCCAYYTYGVFIPGVSDAGARGDCAERLCSGGCGGTYCPKGNRHVPGTFTLFCGDL